MTRSATRAASSFSTPVTWGGAPSSAAAASARPGLREPMITRFPGEGQPTGQAAPLIPGAAQNRDHQPGGFFCYLLRHLPGSHC